MKLRLIMLIFKFKTMKKKEMDLFDVVKAAVLEALVEFTNPGVAMASEEPVLPGEAPDNGGIIEDGDNDGKKEDESGKGGASEESSGGGLNNGRPIPDGGVGAFSLRD